MKQESTTAPKGDSEAKSSTKPESSKPRTKNELYEWAFGSKGEPDGFTTDESAYLRFYKAAQDEDEVAEDDDFDCAKFVKESREKRAAKEAQSLEPKKAQADPKAKN